MIEKLIIAVAIGAAGFVLGWLVRDWFAPKPKKTPPEAQKTKTDPPEMKPPPVAVWREIDRTRRELQRLKKVRAAEHEQNKNRDRRIRELREKNAELTARLCNRVRKANMPASSKKRAGKKLSKDLAGLSEGCAAWCLVDSHGKPPQSTPDGD